MQEKRVLCASCDIYCHVGVEVEDGTVKRVKALDKRKWRANICMKGVHAPEGFAHPKRILKPLKRVGERGSGQWEEVSWDEAMDDIAARLKTVIADHGPEALAVTTSSWNTQSDNGLSRRFMNLVGSPNWISGVALCAGNTAAVNRMVYGWYPYPDFTKTECIVLFGHSPGPHSWTPVYNQIQRARERGAKLIVLDPRETSNAKMADLWLPLKAGTDAAMMFGWLKVILDESLYDRDFVANWTVGFEEFRARVDEFPLERIEQITGVDRDLIAQAARLYATSGPSVIPWTPITDQQRNSTSAIRLQGILRALCGHLDVPGGEVLHGLHPHIIHDTVLEKHEALPQAQKDKQLGADQHPVFTYRGMEPYNGPAKKVWGHEYANLLTGCYMANPSALFRAMAHGDPYRVKAFFILGNNPLMSYANMQLIHEAMMNQDLIVAMEHVMTPSAELADYVLPGDAWIEREALSDGLGWCSIFRTSEQAVEAPGEARNVFDFWTGMAKRFDLQEHFPWASLKELLDYRVAPMGMSFDEVAANHPVHMEKLTFKKYEDTGFATPSGKVELYSETLESFGFDPLPYWREEPEEGRDWPLRLFTGVREPSFFQTGHRHIKGLRKFVPEPLIFMNPADAEVHGVTEGDMVDAATTHGSVRMKVTLKEKVPEELLRVPHGWWLPEDVGKSGGLQSAWQLADAQLCSDSPDFIDREQGIPHFRGLPCCVTKVDSSGQGDSMKT
jgi:acetylene hydratase